MEEYSIIIKYDFESLSPLKGDQVREGEEGCQDSGNGDGRVHHLLAPLLPHQRHLGHLHGLHQQPGRRLPGRSLNYTLIIGYFDGRILLQIAYCGSFNIQ